MASKERHVYPKEVESLKNRRDTSHSILRENYSETIDVLLDYEGLENPPSVAPTSKITDKTDTDYSTKQLSQRLYPFAEVGIIDIWGGGASSTTWDLSQLSEQYLEEVRDELDDIFEDP